MLEPGIRQQQRRKFDSPQAHLRQDQQQQRTQQRQRNQRVGCALEDRAHLVDIDILMRSGKARLGMMNVAVVTVNGNERLAAVEAEMQVVAQQPHRYKRNACEQNQRNSAAGSTHAAETSTRPRQRPINRVTPTLYTAFSCCSPRSPDCDNGI
jgi:hypothetical protein